MTDIPYGKRITSIFKSLFHPPKSWVFFNTSDITVTKNETVEVLSTDTVLVGRHDKILLCASIPIRTQKEKNAWEGAYLNINAKVNDVWYNLGNSGWVYSMGHKSGTISIASINKLLDFPTWENLNDDYMLKIEIKALAYENDIRVNKDCNINETKNNLDERGTVYQGDLNYANVILRAVR